MPGRLTRVPPHPARRPCCAEPYGRMWSMFPRSTCCRCLVGPHWPVLICTYLMLLVPIFVLFVYSIVLAVEAWQSVVFILVCSLPVSCLTITACKDPGAQRRNMPSNLDAEQGVTIMFQETMDGGGASIDPTTGQRLTKFCRYCNAHQPINTVHCQDCDVCIADLDHHCPWMGKCVGKGNILYFNAFLGTLFLAIVAGCLMLFRILLGPLLQ